MPGYTEKDLNRIGLIWHLYNYQPVRPSVRSSCFNEVRVTGMVSTSNFLCRSESTMTKPWLTLNFAKIHSTFLRVCLWNLYYIYILLYDNLNNVEHMCAIIFLSRNEITTAILISTSVKRNEKWLWICQFFLTFWDLAWVFMRSTFLFW